MVRSDRLIGSKEAAQMLGIDRSTLIRWIRQGKIAPADKWEGHTGPYQFAYADVARLVAERRRAA